MNETWVLYLPLNNSVEQTLNWRPVKKKLARWTEGKTMRKWGLSILSFFSFPFQKSLQLGCLCTVISFPYVPQLFILFSNNTCRTGPWLTQSVWCLSTLSFFIFLGMATKWYHLWKRRLQSWKWASFICNKTSTSLKFPLLFIPLSQQWSRKQLKKVVDQKFKILEIKLKIQVSWISCRMGLTDGLKKFKRFVIYLRSFWLLFEHFSSVE